MILYEVIYIMSTLSTNVFSFWIWEFDFLRIWKFEIWKCENLKIWNLKIWKSEIWKSENLKIWKSENLKIWKSMIFWFSEISIFRNTYNVKIIRNKTSQIHVISIVKTHVKKMIKKKRPCGAKKRFIIYRYGVFFLIAAAPPPSGGGAAANAAPPKKKKMRSD